MFCWSGKTQHRGCSGKCARVSDQREVWRKSRQMTLSQPSFRTIGWHLWEPSPECYIFLPGVSAQWRRLPMYPPGTAHLAQQQSEFADWQVVGGLHFPGFPCSLSAQLDRQLLEPVPHSMHNLTVTLSPASVCLFWVWGGLYSSIIH